MDSAMDEATRELLRDSLRHILVERASGAFAEQLRHLGWDEVVADDPVTARSIAESAGVALARIHRRELTPAASGCCSSSLGDRPNDDDHDDDRHDHGERVEQQAKRLALAAQRVQHKPI